VYQFYPKDDHKDEFFLYMVDLSISIHRCTYSFIKIYPIQD